MFGVCYLIVEKRFGLHSYTACPTTPYFGVQLQLGRGSKEEDWEAKEAKRLFDQFGTGADPEEFGVSFTDIKSLTEKSDGVFFIDKNHKEFRKIPKLEP